MTPGERWNTGGVFQTYSAAGMMSITTPWRRRRTRRRSRGRAACGRRLGARLTEARNLHRAAGRLRLAFFQVLRRALDYGGPLDRTGNLPRAALIEVSLQELADQLLTPPVQLAFEFALTHLLGFGRTEEGFGLSEGGLGCCTRRLVGGSGAVGHGSRRSTLRQPLLRTSREPSRHYGHRRGISFPIETYQNAARMSRGGGPEGQTGAPRRRDQAGLPALAARKQAGANAVPPHGAPKRAPVSETPMNREENALRRRAAPISFPPLWTR